LQKPTLFLFVLFLSCNTGDGLMRFSMNFWAAQVLHNWLVDRQVADQVSLRQLLPSPAALSPPPTRKVHVGEILYESSLLAPACTASKTRTEPDMHHMT